MLTRGEQMLALRRARMASSPPFLRGGFRPFFFGGAAWAILALTLWLLSLAGILQLPTAMDALAWHRHEMLFGFVGAVIAGFLLTAIPNWTGRLPIAGPPLALFFGVWVAGRAAVLFSGTIGLVPAAVIDVGFLLLLAWIGAQEVLAAKNRNLPVVGMVLFLALANALDYLAIAGLTSDSLLGMRVGIAAVTILISLIGGRIIPSFTRNWLMKRGVRDSLPTQPGRFDILTIMVTAVAFLAWLAMPGMALAGVLLTAAGVLQLVRLLRWQGYRTVADPLVLILHVAFLWVPTGLLLLGATQLGAPIPETAAIHALTAGAMASMILAVMTRASLGHTGRELRADGATQLVYLLITVGAVIRVLAPLEVDHYTELMRTSGVLWGGAFMLFLVRYSSILFGRRIGESE